MGEEDAKTKKALKKEKKSKKHKKEHKKKDEDHSDDDDDDHSEDDKATSPGGGEDDRKRKREERKRQKQELLDKIPKVDKDGISYTRQQIRKMVRRVKRGLEPVPTPQEEAELKRQEAQLKKEEEMELSGMLYEKEEEEEEDDDSGDDNASNPDEGEDDDDDDDDASDGEEEDEDAAKKDKGKHSKSTSHEDATKRSSSSSPNKKRRSGKPVPDDYVCQACKNKHDFPHWIYDCPDKVTVRGTNQVSAGKRNATANNAPSDKKVFVSGLFFSTKASEVKAMFKSCGKVTSCKLLAFPDTGRCKGQAFVVFETEEAAKKALKMSGTKLSMDDADEDDKKNKKSTKRELELKVTKVKSRGLTKSKK